jgi:amidohydrolase
VLDYHRGVPPVVNEAVSVGMLSDAMDRCFGPGQVEGTEQSLGGEDFSWYLEQAPGALARLGVRGLDEQGSRDLHQGTFDADEGAIGVALELFTALVLG